MHYHLEIIMPPVDDIELAISDIMNRFDENNEDNSNSFWDWYQIGGRYSGSKIKSFVPQEKLDSFYDELKHKGITVKGLVCGKEEIFPESQIPEVDRLWVEMCPNAGDKCPIFNHSGQEQTNDDICTFEKIHEYLQSYAVIIAGENYEENGMEAKHLISKEVWNGVSWVSTIFDGFVKKEIDRYVSTLGMYTDEYKEKYTPKKDWIVVTIDYHN